MLTSVICIKILQKQLPRKLTKIKHPFPKNNFKQEARTLCTDPIDPPCAPTLDPPCAPTLDPPCAPTLDPPLTLVCFFKDPDTVNIQFYYFTAPYL